MIEIEIDGLERLLALTDPVRFGYATDRILERGVQMWRDATKKLPPVSAKTTGYGEAGIPVDTGRLRQSVQARRVSAIAAEVYAPVTYASHVHDGTSRVPARPFFDWSFEFGTQAALEGIVAEEFTRAMSE